MNLPSDEDIVWSINQKIVVENIYYDEAPIDFFRLKDTHYIKINIPKEKDA